METGIWRCSPPNQCTSFVQVRPYRCSACVGYRVRDQFFNLFPSWGDSRVRVIAQLIDARTDAHLWAEHYDRPLNDVFAIQSEVAQAIADQLNAKLSPEEKASINQRPTSDLVAYDLYVRAEALRADTSFSSRLKENLLEAARLCEQAIAPAPTFFLAYCRLPEGL